MVRDLPFSALQFAFYEQFKRWSTTIRRKWKGSTKALNDYVPWEIVNGIAAGGLAGMITTPLGIQTFRNLSHCLDVVKTRIQTSTRSTPKTLLHKSDAALPLGAGYLSQPANIKTESVITALKHVYKHEGWKGLFRGMGPRSGWCGSQSGVMFLGYEFFLRILDDWEGRLLDVGR